MAKNMQPIAKRCPCAGHFSCRHGLCQEGEQPQSRRPDEKEEDEYALQLTEKQKVKFVYGIMEKQFRMYYEKAARMPGKTVRIC